MKTLYLFPVAAVFTLFSGCADSSQPGPSNEIKAEQAIRENLAEAEKAQKEYIKLQQQRNSECIVND